LWRRFGRAALKASGWVAKLQDARRGPDLSWLSDGDVFYNALHGEFGEDGVVQGLLRFANKPISGSDVSASALTIDKSRTKQCAHENGVRTATSCVLSSAMLEELASGGNVSALVDTIIRDQFNAVQASGNRVVIKPNAEGSSVGLDIVDTKNLIPALKKYAQKQHLVDAQSIEPKDAYKKQSVIIEEYIEGVELSVAVLSVGRYVEAIGVAEIELGSDTYDYEAKYKSNENRYHCPARVSASDAQLLLAEARRIHQACGCNGLSRSDFILSSGSGSAHDQQRYFLEINTSPGLTPSSLYPKIAAARGFEFSDVVHWSLSSCLGGISNSDAVGISATKTGEAT